MSYLPSYLVADHDNWVFHPDIQLYILICNSTHPDMQLHLGLFLWQHSGGYNLPIAGNGVATIVCYLFDAYLLRANLCTYNIMLRAYSHSHSISRTQIFSCSDFLPTSSTFWLQVRSNQIYCLHALHTLTLEGYSPHTDTNQWLVRSGWRGTPCQ